MKGAGVGGLVAEVEGEGFGVGDLTGGWVEGGVLEGLGALGEPVRFRHGVYEDGLGFGVWLMFSGQ